MRLHPEELKLETFLKQFPLIKRSYSISFLKGNPPILEVSRGVQRHRKHHVRHGGEIERLNSNTAELKPNQVHGGTCWLLLKIK